MNNSDRHYDPSLPDSRCDELLDRYFEGVAMPDVDTTGITILTHMKVLQNSLIRSRRRWKLFAIASVAACAVIAFVLSGRLMSPLDASGIDSRYAEAVGEEGRGYSEMTVPTGQRMTFILPDGTTMIANSRSKVRYPARFDGRTRDVWVSGEVYFDVTKDATRPFIVSSDGFRVKVYGTRFNISNYNHNEASVVLVEGSVAVTTDSDENVNMHPGRMVTIRSGAIDNIRDVDTALYTSWIDGGLMLENHTLGEIAAKLANYYGVEIDVATSLRDSRLYGCLDLKSGIDEVLEVLCSIIPMTVEPLPGESRYNLNPTK